MTNPEELSLSSQEKPKKSRTTMTVRITGSWTVNVRRVVIVVKEPKDKGK